VTVLRRTKESNYSFRTLVFIAPDWRFKRPELPAKLGLSSCLLEDLIIHNIVFNNQLNSHHQTSRPKKPDGSDHKGRMHLLDKREQKNVHYRFRTPWCLQHLAFIAPS
jgi:hypothetical protein